MQANAINTIAENVVMSTAYRRITVGAIAAPDGIICIDVPPYPMEARHWRALLLEHFNLPIKLIILTDAHRDRLLGLHWYEKADIIAHDATYEAIRALPSTYSEQAADALSSSTDDRLSFAGVRLRRPRITFTQRMTAYVGDFGLPLLAMPGPTPGNVWVHLPDRGVVFTGDSVVVDRPLYMGRMQSKLWLESLTKLRRSRFVAESIVPGRGTLTDKDSTQAISEFLRYARRRVLRLYRAGRPRTDIVDIVPSVVEHMVEHMGVRVSPGQEEDVHRRLKIGLDAVYDEYAAADEVNAEET